MVIQIFSKLLGNSAVFSLQHRILNLIALVGMAMSFSACVINYVLGLETITVVLPFACGVVTVGLYLISVIGKKYSGPAMATVIMLSFIFFPAMWLINGGTYGSIPFYMLINTGITVILLSGFKRVLVLALYFVEINTLLIAEYHIPGLISGYDSRLIRYSDVSFGYTTCLFFIAIVFGILVDSYTKERQRAEQYLAAIKEQNGQIKAKNVMLEKNNAELKRAKERAESLNRMLGKEKEKLKKLSITDGLTGVYNKLYITSRLADEVEASRKEQRTLTVALIDIDDFKSVNDTYGHLFGDYVLRRVGETIVNSLRPHDIVGRYGGEEFLFVLPDTDKKYGFMILERIRKRILDIPWEHNLKITISGGVTEMDRDQATDLLKRADTLLYKAKCKGKNRIEKEPA